MEKEIKLGIYRILRKLGVNRDEIKPETQFQNDLFFDEIDWNCFLFFVESKFNISISNDEEGQLQTIENSIDIIDRHLHQVEVC
jgi:acyl carrier protein